MCRPCRLAAHSTVVPKLRKAQAYDGGPLRAASSAARSWYLNLKVLACRTGWSGVSGSAGAAVPCCGDGSCAATPKRSVRGVGWAAGASAGAVAAADAEPSLLCSLLLPISILEDVGASSSTSTTVHVSVVAEAGAEVAVEAQAEVETVEVVEVEVDAVEVEAVEVEVEVDACWLCVLAVVGIHLWLGGGGGGGGGGLRARGSPPASALPATGSSAALNGSTGAGPGRRQLCRLRHRTTKVPTSRESSTTLMLPAVMAMMIV